MAKIKQLFRGTFNYPHKLKVLRLMAYSQRQAWVLMCRKLAKADGVHHSIVMDRFDGRDCTVELEVEIKEVET